MNLPISRLAVHSVLIVVLSIMLMSCNTFKGFGKDMEKGGKNIQRSADKTQSEQQANRK